MSLLSAALVCVLEVTGLPKPSAMPAIEIRALTLSERLSTPMMLDANGNPYWPAIGAYDWRRSPPVLIVEPGPEWRGVLAHELCHHMQRAAGLPFDEKQCRQVQRRCKELPPPGG